MRDYLEIGSVPADEQCEQLGPNYDEKKARKECRVFINQLRRIHGPEPFGANLKVKSNPHDFGTYYEVACYYDDENEEAMNYAFNCEDIPENWDDEAKRELQTE